MEIIRIPRIMQDTSKVENMRGRSIGLVPTMGALHDGHMSLIRSSKMEDQITVVSIFVNPLQFAEGEDYEAYPGEFEEDMKKLRSAGVDILFLPDKDQMYPKGFATKITAGDIPGRLCGAFRPGHFEGVAIAVCKLLNIVKPVRAYFGQKDYQQTLVVSRMARDLNIPSEIVVCPTIREESGLALSSRNAYLSEKDRASAGSIYKTLKDGERMLKDNQSPEYVSMHMKKVLSMEPAIKEVQYCGVYNPDTLDEISEFKGSALLACAVYIGKARLIDNIII